MNIQLLLQNASYKYKSKLSRNQNNINSYLIQIHSIENHVPNHNKFCDVCFDVTGGS